MKLQVVAVAVGRLWSLGGECSSLRGFSEGERARRGRPAAAGLGLLPPAPPRVPPGLRALPRRRKGRAPPGWPETLAFCALVLWERSAFSGSLISNRTPERGSIL